MKNSLLSLGLLVGAAAPLTHGALALPSAPGGDGCREKAKAACEQERKACAEERAACEREKEACEREAGAVARRAPTSFDAEIAGLEAEIARLVELLERGDIGVAVGDVEDLEDHLADIEDVLQDQLEDQADAWEDWADDHAEAWEEWADEWEGHAAELELDGEEWNAHWEDWAGDWEDWASEWEADWEDWGAEWAADWEDWGAEWEADWEDWAEEFQDACEDADSSDACSEEARDRARELAAEAHHFGELARQEAQAALLAHGLRGGDDAHVAERALLQVAHALPQGEARDELERRIHELERLLHDDEKKTKKDVEKLRKVERKAAEKAEQAREKAARKHEKHEKHERKEAKRSHAYSFSNGDGPGFSFDIHTEAPNTIRVIAPDGASGRFELHELEDLEPGTYVLHTQHGEVDLQPLEFDVRGHGYVVAPDGGSVAWVHGDHADQADAPRSRSHGGEVEELTRLLDEMRAEMRDLRASLRELRDEVRSLRHGAR